MADVKIVLRKKELKDGTYPLALRITQNRKSSFIHLGHNVKEGDWDAKNQQVKKSHPNSVRLNNLLLKKRAEANDHSIELKTTKTIVSAQAVKQKVKPATGSSFFDQAQLYIDRLKADGKYNRYTPDKSRLEHFKTWLKHDHAFQDISVAMLERFKAYVSSKSGLGLSERTAVNHLVVIRSVFSQAIKEGVIDERNYPFGKGKISIKFPESNKVGLNTDDIKKLEEVSLEGKANHARNLWLFSYYFAGMRVSDVFRLRWSDLQNDRLHYSMGKNNKAGSLKVPGKALAILDQYIAFKENANDLIFPELKEANFSDRFSLERTIGFKTSAIDKVLKTDVANTAKIEKKLTMHISRHTFAQLAGDKISIQMLQKLYRHSNITTTLGYQSNFINKEADDALDAVLNLNS